MRVNISTLIWGLTLFLNRGLMAEQVVNPHLPQHWVTIQDGETGLQADFPDHPLKMTFDVPFQNTPSTGQLHLYSFPTQTGLLVLGAFHSPNITSDYLQQEQLHQFFETFLVPHLFHYPAVFQNHQIFNFQPSEFNGQEAASFQYFFQDHQVMKKLEGLAFIKGQTLYIPFYLSSEKEFDAEMFHRFLHSISFSKVPENSL